MTMKQESQLFIWSSSFVSIGGYPLLLQSTNNFIIFCQQVSEFDPVDSSIILSLQKLFFIFSSKNRNI